MRSRNALPLLLDLGGVRAGDGGHTLPGDGRLGEQGPQVAEHGGVGGVVCIDLGAMSTSCAAKPGSASNGPAQKRQRRGWLRNFGLRLVAFVTDGGKMHMDGYTVDALRSCTCTICAC